MHSSKHWLSGFSRNSLGTSTALKKAQEEIKFTLSEIKKSLQGINNRVDEAENQINDLEHKEEKKHSIRTAIRKKNPKRMRMG